MSSPTASIDQLFEKRKILIVCGTGGVGKTTLSSAIALKAALQGKKALVVTMDPAKRLKTALGLESLGDTPVDLTAQIKSKSEIKGHLFALSPDTKKSFEHFFRSVSESEHLAEKIFKNPLFQVFAQEFSGTNEYMAMKRLLSLDQEGKYDLIVLDTPPSRNTLAFIEAPKLLSRLFEDQIIQNLVNPVRGRVEKWLGSRIASGIAHGMRKALGLLEGLTGSEFMIDLIDFAKAIYEIRGGFSQNLKKVEALMQRGDVGFVMALSGEPSNQLEVAHFIGQLDSHRLQFDGLILNRLLSQIPEGDPKDPLFEEPSGKRGQDLFRSICDRERQAIEGLPRESVLARLPELARDVHSLEDLIHVSSSL